MDDSEIMLAMITAGAEAAAKEGTNMISSAMGCLFPFATAKRDAVKTYIEEIKKSDISPESKMIAIGNVKNNYKYLCNQLKIKEIAENTAKEGTDFSLTSGVREEFVDRFMDSAKFVSDEEMQIVWGRILAKEFEEPGSTPPKLTRILSEITPKYAVVFQNICSLSIGFTSLDKDNNPIEQETCPFIICKPNVEYIKGLGISFAQLNELCQMGLIQYEPGFGLIKAIDKDDVPSVSVSYGNQVRIATNYQNKGFPIGEVALTDAGMVLAEVTEKKIIEGHFDFVIKEMENGSVVFAQEID